MIQQLSLFGGSSLSEPYTVSQLTGHIRQLFDDDPELSSVWVEGEVSNFSRAGTPPRQCGEPTPRSIQDR